MTHEEDRAEQSAQEIQNEQRRRQLLAAQPLAIRSWFEPGKGFTIGFAARSEEAPTVDMAISKILFEDLATAERDLDSIVMHLRDSIRNVIANNSYIQGRQSVLQEQVKFQADAAAAKDINESAEMLSAEQSLAEEDGENSETLAASEDDEQVIDLSGAAKTDA